MEIKILAKVMDRQYTNDMWEKTIESEVGVTGSYNGTFMVGTKRFSLKNIDYKLDLGVLSATVNIEARGTNQNEIQSLTDALHIEGFTRTSNQPLQ